MDSALPTVLSAFNSFTHSLRTKRNISIEYREVKLLGHPLCSRSNVKSCFIRGIFTIIYKNRPFPNRVVPSGIQPLLQFLRLLMTFTHPLGTQRGIPIEPRGGHLRGPTLMSWIWPTLWVSKGAFKFNPEGAASCNMYRV